MHFGSSRRIQIRILAHLPLHFLPFLFVVEQHLAVVEVAAFDFALGFVEQRLEAGERAAAGELLAALLCSFSAFFGPKAGLQDFVVEREELPIRAGIALPAAAADELAVDALRLRAARCRSRAGRRARRRRRRAGCRCRGRPCSWRR